jgi:hypothetical protein
MTKIELNTFSCLTALLAISILAVGVAGAASTKAKAKGPKREMLFKIFKPIMSDIGPCNVQKGVVLSGPVAMKMTNNKAPGKQWHVQLGQSKFKITIEDASKMTLAQVLDWAERIPAPYRHALVVVSEKEKSGLAIYKTLGGAAAHGGQGYLNMIPLKPDRAASVIVHEAGHILEQRARTKEKDILDQWAAACKADGIDVSNYGNGTNHEDIAEFARVYAFCIDPAAGPAMKPALQKLSPKRFELWEHALTISGALPSTCSKCGTCKCKAAARLTATQKAKQLAGQKTMAPKIKTVQDNINALPAKAAK